MRPRAEQPAITLILRMLEESELSAYVLAQRLGIDVRNTRQYMALLHQDRKVHIAAWEKAGIHGNGPPVPVWALGKGIDAQRPIAMDRKTQMARFRARSRSVIGLTHQLFRRAA